MPRRRHDRGTSNSKGGQFKAGSRADQQSAPAGSGFSLAAQRESEQASAHVQDSPAWKQQVHELVADDRQKDLQLRREAIAGEPQIQLDSKARGFMENLSETHRNQKAWPVQTLSELITSAEGSDEDDGFPEYVDAMEQYRYDKDPAAAAAKAEEWPDGDPDAHGWLDDTSAREAVREVRHILEVEGQQQFIRKAETSGEVYDASANPFRGLHHLPR